MRDKSIKTLSVILAVIMLFGNFTALAAEREVVASGTYGGVNWTIYNDGELYIHGSGKLGMVSTGAKPPWSKYNSSVSRIKIGKDVSYGSPGYSIVSNACIYTNLKEIIVEEGNSFFSTEDNVLFNYDKTELILFPTAVVVQSYTVPESVESVHDAAFMKSLITNISIPYGVKTIRAYAFSSTKISSVDIPDSVEFIGAFAFSSCTNITDIKLSANMTAITQSTFASCVKIESITFPEKIQRISDSAFANCDGLKYVYIPENIEEINASAFRGCDNLEAIRVESAEIGTSAFAYCPKLKEVTLSDSVTAINKNVFENCTSLEEISIPCSVTSLGYYFLNGCSSLKSINVDLQNPNYSSDSHGVLFNKNKTHLFIYPIGNTADYYHIPDSVTQIASSAFQNAQKLNSVIMSDNIEYIGADAFTDSGIYNDKANWDNGFFYIGTCLIDADPAKLNKECILYSKTTLIASNVFYNTDITSVTMSDEVLYINDTAFCLCQKLEKIYLSKKLKSIGIQSFYGCDSLSEITLPVGISEIPAMAFYGCDALSTINLNKGLSKIDKYAFAYLKISEIEIPSTVTLIDPMAFDNSNITDIFYGDNKAQWKRATGGESFDGITVHYTLKSDDESVIIQHTDNNFTWEAGNVHLKVEDLTNVTTSYEQNGFYNRLLANPIQVLDIKLVDGDEKPIQPLSDEKITVKIKASDEFMAMLKTALSSVSEYDIAADKIDFVDDSFVFEADGETVTVPAAEKFLKSFKVIHWKSDAVLPTDHESFTHDMLEVKNGYIVLQTNHFSEYAVCTDMLEFEQTELEIENGKTAQLKIKIDEGSTVTYTSSDESVAKVDSNGVVTAVGPGIATITATVDGTGVSAKCTVNVPFRTFTVKWVVDGVATEQEVTEQSPLTAPAEAPEKAGYIFKGWSPAIPDTMPAKNLTFTAVFEAAPVTEIEIITAPIKTAYTYKSGNIDLSGIELKVTYEDGYSETVTDTSKMTVSGFDSKKVGNQTVTVEYAGATADFQVGVSYAWWQWIIRIILLGIFWY